MNKRKWQKWIKKYRFFLLVAGVFVFFFYFLFMMQKNHTHLFQGFIQDFSYRMQEIFLPKVQVDFHDVHQSIGEEKEREWAQFRSLLDLKTVYSSYHLSYASVISRTNEMWFQTITINRGSADGIEKNSAVIDEFGLVGKVVNVRKHTADVKLLTASSEDMKISVYIEHDGQPYAGVLQGYDEKENLLQAISLRNVDVLKVGDIIKTSGLGGVFPSGIPVGVVEKTEYDSLGVQQFVKIRSAASFDRLQYVGIVRREES